MPVPYPSFQRSDGAPYSRYCISCSLGIRGVHCVNEEDYGRVEEMLDEEGVMMRGRVYISEPWSKLDAGKSCGDCFGCRVLR
jgi:hypothetical protein